MKSVRLFYTKGGSLRFVSHLDMNRFLTRLLRMSKLPVWYTEGFHKHPYIAFALPLSLGFFSTYEVMDFRLTDDTISLEAAQAAIARVCPDGLSVLSLREPLMKPGKIESADFCVRFFPDSGVTAQGLEAFLKQPEIVIEKQSKKGTAVKVDLAPKLHKVSVVQENDGLCLRVNLPAGGADNVNPKLLLDAYFASIGKSSDGCCQITRTMLYAAGMQQFE